MALLIINLTPASAIDMVGIQNNVNKLDNYAHADWWYKFWHFFELIDSMGSLLSQVVDTANELPSDLQRGVEILPKAISDRNELDERNEKLKILSNYYSNDALKSDWVNDTDRSNELENDITNNETPNTNNLTEKTNTNTKKTAQITTNNVGNSSNSSGNPSSYKLSNNEVTNESNIENKTNNTHKKNASTPPQEVINHANYTQEQLKKEGFNVNVIHYNLDQLQKNDLVQLVDINGFIKYMVYEGNTTQDGNPAFTLYNGESSQTVTYNKFVTAYTGIVLELVDKNDTNVTTIDLAEKLYSTQLTTLTQKIGVFSDWISVGSAMEWLGGAVIGLTVILTAAAAIFAVCGEKVLAITAAVIAAIVIVIIAVVGIAILVTGMILVSVLQKNSDNTKAEQADLTSHCI